MCRKWDFFFSRAVVKNKSHALSQYFMISVFRFKVNKSTNMNTRHPVGDLYRQILDAPSKYFHFHAVFRKIWLNYRFILGMRPHLEILVHPLYTKEKCQISVADPGFPRQGIINFFHENCIKINEIEPKWVYRPLSPCYHTLWIRNFK